MPPLFPPAGPMVALSVLFLVLWFPPHAAAEFFYSLGTGIEFASGDYGTEETTDSYTVPFILDLYPGDRLDFELYVPYIHQTASTTVIVGRIRLPSHRTRQPGGGQQVTTAADSISGLGDISLTAGYIVYQNAETGFRIRPTFYLKMPTGDEDEGLGTGEFDYAPGLEFSRWFGDWNGSANASYVIQGGDSFGLQNYWTYGAELGYQVNRDFFPSVSIWGATPPVDGEPHLFEIRAEAKYWLTTLLSLEGYLGSGLTDSSPDIMAGAYLFLHF